MNYPGKSENELLVLNTLVFPYIFLLFDCFEWALIDRIVKCKVHSVLWQFQSGGVHIKIYPPLETGISLYIPIVFHISSLSFLYALVFLYLFLLFFILIHCHFSMHWYFLIYSYYLTVSNGCSLTALSSVKFTQCSGSFKRGGG